MKIAIIGYGKMGHMIESIALERGHEIVGIIDPTLEVSDQPSVISFDSEAFRSADVAIEFTTPQTAEDNIRKAWEQGIPVVCGTTGWNADAMVVEDYKHDRQMLYWSSNFSIGMNLFFDLNKDLAFVMKQHSQYTPSITEIHHIHKLDKPSGTAKTLAEQIGMNVAIESIREGEVPGTHTVKWDSEEDTILITHIAKGRRGFALGAVVAAEYLGSY